MRPRQGPNSWPGLRWARKRSPWCSRGSSTRCPTAGLTAWHSSTSSPSFALGFAPQDSDPRRVTGVVRFDQDPAIDFTRAARPGLFAQTSEHLQLNWNTSRRPIIDQHLLAAVAEQIRYVGGWRTLRARGRRRAEHRQAPPRVARPRPEGKAPAAAVRANRAAVPAADAPPGLRAAAAPRVRRPQRAVRRPVPADRRAGRRRAAPPDGRVPS